MKMFLVAGDADIAVREGTGPDRERFPADPEKAKQELGAKAGR